MNTRRIAPDEGENGMNGKRKRHTLVWGFTRTEMLGVLAIVVVFAVILYPLFQRSRSSPNGAVRNASGNPVPSAILRFRDPAGRLVSTITADKNGEFRQAGLDGLSRDAVDGFRQSYSVHRSGSSDLYVFTPLETRTAAFCDESGKPLPGLTISFGPDHNAWQHRTPEPHEQVCDSKGTIRIHRDPESTYFEFQSLNPDFIVERFQRSDDGHTIHYAVTVTQPGAITGCVRGKDGRPLPSYEAFATISPDLDHFDRWNAAHLNTGADGRFRITNLRPRVYYVSAAPALGSHTLLPARRVTIAPGQTADVSLQADATDLTPDVH